MEARGDLSGAHPRIDGSTAEAPVRTVSAGPILSGAGFSMRTLSRERGGGAPSITTAGL
jgi:hypothetical protein